MWVLFFDTPSPLLTPPPLSISPLSSWPFPGVIPYLPYSRHCKMRKRGCITAKLIAGMMCKAGMHQLITLDLRHKEIQGFFDFTVDNLRGSPFLVKHIREQVWETGFSLRLSKHKGMLCTFEKLKVVLMVFLCVI